MPGYGLPYNYAGCILASVCMITGTGTTIQIPGKNIAQSVITQLETKAALIKIALITKPMKAKYSDILALTDKPPVWYDSNGTPRFRQFHPDDLPSIYAKVGVLLEISCQACNRRFLAGLYLDELIATPGLDSGSRTLKNLHEWKSNPKVLPFPLHYGDPPRHGSFGHDTCCVAGDTMSSIGIRVVEYWEKHNFEWHRFTHLEGDIVQ